MLPYPPTGAYTWDLIFLVLYLIIENTRLFQASKGNRTKQIGPLVLSMVLAIPALVCNIYYLQLQTYALRLDEILNGFSIAVICCEVFFSILTLLLLLGKHSV
ncbi:hypothetical protein Gpo141_00001398 [Globisporangium polare]